MSWAEVHVLDDKMTNLSNATLYINVGTDYANETVMVKRYDSDYAEVTLDSQGTAEVAVQPKSRYEIVTTDPNNSKTSNVFYVEAGAYKEVGWAADMPDGDTVLPIDDPVVWQKCAGIYELYGYEDLAHIKADSACYLALLASDNANKYLFRSYAVIGDNILNFEPICATIGQMPAFIKKLATAPYWMDMIYNSPYRTRLYNAISPKVSNAATAWEGNRYVSTDAQGNKIACSNGSATTEWEGEPYYLINGYNERQDGKAVSIHDTGQAYTAANPHPVTLIFNLEYEFAQPTILKRFEFTPGRIWGYYGQGIPQYGIAATYTLYGTNDISDPNPTYTPLGNVYLNTDNVAWSEFVAQSTVIDLHDNTTPYKRYRLVASNANTHIEYSSYTQYAGLGYSEISLEGVYAQVE